MSNTTHLLLNDDEKENILDVAPKIIRSMTDHINQGGNTLVHCAAGISRSVSMVQAYLMHTHNMPEEDALMHIRRVRPQANPDPSFRRQLKILEEQFRKMM